MRLSFVLTTLVAAAAAVPVAWTPALGETYTAIDQVVKRARRDSCTPASCDLSKAQQPTASPALPAPTGLTLAQVAIGRGIQNYTCANQDSTTKPVAIGAVANLYNVDCIASNYPQILAMLPNLALQYDTPSGNDAMQPANSLRSGHHFFNSAGVPTFSMDDNGDNLGVMTGSVVDKVPAPADAVKGQNNQGYGSVAWLYLTATSTTVGPLKAVYRLNTAGGDPPLNCSGQPSTISVQYAAEYWLYT